MAIPILIMGESGTGKSSSIRTLDPKETFIIQIYPRALPFKNNYQVAKGVEDWNLKTNNLYKCKKGKETEGAITVLKKIEMDRPEIKNIIIDDFQYAMAIPSMLRGEEIGFKKFTQIAKNAFDLITYPTIMREGLNVIFMTHSEIDENGFPKVKTSGKMLDSLINIPGLFTLIFYSQIIDEQYFFQTKFLQNVKTPMGMYEEKLVANDLQKILNKVQSYYNNDEGKANE